MKATIKYEYNSDGGIDASIRLPEGIYACANGKTREEARENVINRAKQRMIEIPSEEVEL